MRKFLMIFIPIAIVLGFFVLTSIIIALNKKPEEKKRSFNTLAVIADYAVQDDVQLSVTTQGEARPRTEIDLVPEVGGKIVYVSPNFIEGGIIRKGETLIRVEDSDYKVNVIRAKANIAQAEQVLIREKAEGEIARQDYEELGRGEASALALRQPQQAQAEASLMAAQAELETAELQLKRTAVRAPFDGRVRTKSSDLGQFVSPGRALGRIFSTDIVEVRLPLTDADLSKIDLPIAFVAKDRASAPDVTLSAVIGGKTQFWNGKIMRTDPTYDTQTRALFAIAEVFDPYGDGSSENGVPLPPGLFVDAVVKGKTFENVIVLPRDGLRPEDEVYVVNDKGKVDVRVADVLDTDADKAFLFSGVEAGELVVLSPMEKSRVSMTLKVLDAEDPTKILVDPPEPEWMKKMKEAEKDGKKKKRRWGKKDGTSDEKIDEPSAKKSDKKKSNEADTGDGSAATSESEQ
ncbi:efflux RND transporter periplasmic adaptor subunit [Hellea balneolensis]|uniref:efflux RND transporter periplasmic adaptor subunit n=1 Tax=Hellea balneolensis TaxID=287478 RepID=UPI00138AE3B9|nr:efflux RND transporter periplasmic adaptor subunit [Hellea balneolensis]